MHGTRDEPVALPPPFEIVLRGFDRQQVIDHVNALKAHVGAVGAERDAALQRAAGLHEKCEQLRRAAQESATEVDRLQRSPLAVATARIQRMLQIAEDEAAELAATAERETTSLRENARAEADRLLAETRQRCERLEAESRSRCQAEEAQSSARRQRAEQQSERDIASREAETDARIRDYQTRSVAALHLIMHLAGERLSSRMIKAKRQVSAARALRSEVAGQLSEVHRLLAEALGVVDAPTPAEQVEYAESAQDVVE
jgi:cell division septum initiation protein DivIVA